MTRIKTITILAATCAALAVVPAAASAKKSTYEGPINLPRDPTAGRTYVPTIQLKVKFEGKTPTRIVKLIQFGSYGPCSNGTRSYGGNTGKLGREIRVKKNRRFSISNGLSTSEEESFTVTGRIPRKGPPTGTIRIVTHVAESSGPHGTTIPAATCDTGALTWRATRTSHFTPWNELG